MPSTVVAHAGQPTQLHTLVDTLFGVGVGLSLVVLYYLFLRYFVSSDRWNSGGS